MTEQNVRKLLRGVEEVGRQLKAANLLSMEQIKTALRVGDLVVGLDQQKRLNRILDLIEEGTEDADGTEQ